jgi:hypothetical protein
MLKSTTNVLNIWVVQHVKGRVGGWGERNEEMRGIRKDRKRGEGWEGGARDWREESGGGKRSEENEWEGKGRDF